MKKYRFRTDALKHVELGDVIVELKNGCNQYAKPGTKLGEHCIGGDLIKAMPDWFGEIEEAETGHFMGGLNRGKYEKLEKYKSDIGCYQHGTV